MSADCQDATLEPHAEHTLAEHAHWRCVQEAEVAAGRVRERSFRAFLAAGGASLVSSLDIDILSFTVRHLVSSCSENLHHISGIDERFSKCRVAEVEAGTWQGMHSQRGGQCFLILLLVSSAGQPATQLAAAAGAARALREQQRGGPSTAAARLSAPGILHPGESLC